MKISALRRNPLFAIVAVLIVLLSGSTVTPQSEKTALKWIGNLNLNEPQPNADTKLVYYLTSRAQVRIDEEKAQTYEKIIHKLVDWRVEDGPYVARVTPYVFVVASMRGADFDVLATYQSTSPNRSTTYRSYFVVNRTAFTSQPTLDQLMQHLRDRQTPARFVYHDKFSTSSYFLPALFFRNNDIYAMPNSIDNLRAIITEDINSNIVPGQKRFDSSKLVEMVANQPADNMIVAAVWDDTKDNAPAALAEKVYFVPLPNALPNDLLVSSAKLDQKAKKDLRKAIQNMGPNEINQGDFKTWCDIENARLTQQALGELRQLAVQRATAVTIRIINSQVSPVDRLQEEEIRHAIELSKTEFTPFDASYHANADVDWTIEETHDKAIKLVSKINYAKLDPQEFEISFTDAQEDLSRRIGSIIHSRMHRIRYVWPYEDRPTVIRDVEFPILPTSVFKVVKIIWKDPKKNNFIDEEPFDATVVSKDNRFGFELAGAGFPNRFDPLSNVSYRVVLVRPTREGRVFTVLTYAFVGLLVLAAAGAFFDMRRRAKKPSDLPLVDIEKFKRKCRELAEKYRSFWRNHELTEADVLWCDRPRLEKIIADLKTSELNSVTVWTRSLAILANIPVVSKLLGLTAGAGVSVIFTVDQTKFSDAQRLEDTIRYLMAKGALSPFISEKLECDALNEIASSIFEPFNLATSQAGNNNGVQLIRNEHPMLVSRIAEHFNGVLQESKEKVCFFGRKWTVTANDTEQVLVCTADLLTPITLNGGNSAVPKTVQKLTLRAQVSRDADLCDLSQGNELNAWLFGKIHRVEPPRNGDGNLFLNFRPAALVKTDDSE